MARKRRKHYRVAERERQQKVVQEKREKRDIFIGLAVLVAVWLEGFLVATLICKLRNRSEK